LEKSTQAELKDKQFSAESSVPTWGGFYEKFAAVIYGQNFIGLQN
jgi:hypothetical protein